MKKKIVLMLCLALMVTSLVGCGGTDVEPVDEVNKVVATENVDVKNDVDTGEANDVAETTVATANGNIQDIVIDYSFVEGNDDAYLYFRKIDETIKNYKEINPNAYVIIDKIATEGGQTPIADGVSKDSFQPIDIVQAFETEYAGDYEYEVVEYNEDMLILNVTPEMDVEVYKTTLDGDMITFELVYKLNEEQVKAIEDELAE